MPNSHTGTKYFAEMSDIRQLMDAGMEQAAALQMVAADRGVDLKYLRNAWYRYRDRMPEPNGHAPGSLAAPSPGSRGMGAMVASARDLLDVAERACGEIDSLRGVVKARDKEIARLQRQLERGKESQELVQLLERFRAVAGNLARHLPPVAPAGGNGDAA